MSPNEAQQQDTMPFAEEDWDERPVDLTDPDNPEWTEEDFARSRPATDLPVEILAAFPNTPDPRRNKVPISIRLSAYVIEHFKREGEDWEARIDATLREVIAGKR